MMPTIRAQVAPESTPNAASTTITPTISSTQPQFFTLLVSGSTPPVLRRM